MKNYAFGLFIFLCIPLLSPAQNKIVLNTDLGETIINKHIYGHFSEHLGRCIYGGLYAGEENKLVPHINGMRTDVVEALKNLNIPNLRWPGGCFADTYHWKDGIGPKEDRPTIVNTWWGNVTEDNSFGSHEFMELCRQLGTEPYFSANVGSGSVQEMSEWVQYMNFSGKSPMSDLRAENGHEEPFKVKYWGIGNETWGCGGNMTAEYYADLYKRYATYVNTSWDSKEKLFRIASGASDDDYHWTEVMMRDIPHKMLEGIGVHHYSVIDWADKGSATEFDENMYFTTMSRAWDMERLVQGHSTIMDKYDPEKKVAMMVDEWGGWYNVEPGTNGGFLYQQNTMRDAMIAGMTLNIFNNHADRVRMANIAQVVNVLQAVILTDEERIILTPTYHVMEMYKIHQDAVQIPVYLKTEDYVFGDKKLPAISASASKDASGKVHVSVVNIDMNKSHKISLDMRGENFKDVSGRILSSPSIQDHNTFAKPNKITPKKFNGAKLINNKMDVVVPPFSVLVLELN
ncbi:alpha-L-arabinofuranosidase C-terminal domain-containing protein [uncultured Arcticibacterium sp.]|uniref:alpha-N-arabinofuranosidase n=1 Tax=uncultured Arcticibacterium sp. TaxID=2173042 RepID=UPI0030F829E9